jgi:hypothetical protein
MRVGQGLGLSEFGSAVNGVFVREVPLVPNWGDGSGPGAGVTLGWRGTFGLAANPLQM